MSSCCIFDEQIKYFEVEVDVLYFQMPEVLLIFFRLKGFVSNRVFLTLLPLITHSIVLSCFCFKTSFIHFNISNFFSTFSIFFSFLFALNRK